MTKTNKFLPAVGYRDVFSVMLATSAFMLMSFDANATQLCAFLNSQVFGVGTGASNDIVRGIATLGVISVAVGAAFGRVSWGAAVLVAVGIAGLFGAKAIATAMGGGCA